MTTVEFKRTTNKITAFTVHGHSGYAEAGEDIVCASVSSVVWSTVNGLKQIAGIPVEYESREGFVSCSIPPLSETGREKADLLLESMLAFMQELSGQYQQFVKVMEV
ncbi:MAG: ribosomal-processing cysteine protease Prp [Clostridia bacterium]|nr:ribosomal-processing cysteine protease Prp [Oscillospiraceae bacterium]MBQ7032644.1 ribosomal-processing cysteine protease Prp [Clostridia bacterium]